MSIYRGQLLMYPWNSMKLASLGNFIAVRLTVPAISSDQHLKMMVFFLVDVGVVADHLYGVD
jgi:hypothetical protein